MTLIQIFGIFIEVASKINLRKRCRRQCQAFLNSILRVDAQSFSNTHSSSTLVILWFLHVRGPPLQLKPWLVGPSQVEPKMPDDFALGYDKQSPSDSTLFENGSSERSQHSQEAPQLDGSGSLGLETRLSNRGTCQMDDEGDEAELTELAMPLPVEPDSPGRDHLEQAQLEVR